MVLWLILFFLVIAISFILALQSMQDYHEAPRHFNTEYGLFLIRNTAGLTAQLLESLHSQIVKDGLIVTLERLFKGRQSALVIFGPKDILANYSQQLNLLELEDYAQVAKDQTHAWEVGVKPNQIPDQQERKIDNFFKSFPMLEEAEQFWWQLTLQAQPKFSFWRLPNFKTLFGKTDLEDEVDYLKSDSKRSFQSQIRAVIISADLDRRKKLADILQNLPAGHLAKVPKPFTSNQIVEFYQQRSLGRENTNPTLTTEEILRLSLLR